MDKLTVINSMLAFIGETPVTTLEDPEEVTAKALRVLDDEVVSLQSQNYWFNYYQTVLTPDGDGEINLPSNAARVDANNTQIIQRGLKLYNKYNSTYVFSQPITAFVTVVLDFEELPLTARLLCKAYAEWIFETQEQGDNGISNTLRMRIEIAKTRFMDENLQQQNQNVLRNPEVFDRFNRQVLGSGRLLRGTY